MSRYVVQCLGPELNGKWAVEDTVSGKVFHHGKYTEASSHAYQLNLDVRTEKMKEALSSRSEKTSTKVDQIVRLRDVEGMTFNEIAKEIGVSTPLIHRLYHREVERRALVDKLGSSPVSDATPLDDVRHLLPTKLYLALKGITWGVGEPDTVGMIRRTPDEVLKTAPQVGCAAIKIVRDLFGYAPDYKAMSVHEFMVARKGLSKEAA